MRKIVMANWVSVDGFFAGPHGEIDWIVRDPEVHQAWYQLGDMQADTLPESSCCIMRWQARI